MTRDETVQILTILKSAYPNSYKGMSVKEANGVISVWASQFSRIPVEVVVIAINKLISTSQFPPSIKEVREKMKGLYTEATGELLAFNKNISEDKRKKLELIQSVCRNIEEPSLSSLLDTISARALEKDGEDERVKQTLLVEARDSTD